MNGKNVAIENLITETKLQAWCLNYQDKSAANIKVHYHLKISSSFSFNFYFISFYFFVFTSFISKIIIFNRFEKSAQKNLFWILYNFSFH